MCALVCTDWERKGVPLRLEVGPRDVNEGNFVMAARTGGEKESIHYDSATAGSLIKVQTLKGLRSPALS
jgi:prolyl-tRNA synthetase